MSDDRQYAPATLRNRDFILDVLRDVLAMVGVILEIASGSGEHIVHFAKHFPALVFQPSDPDPDARLRWVRSRVSGPKVLSPEVSRSGYGYARCRLRGRLPS